MIYTILYIIIRHLARALPFATLSVMLSLTRYCMPNNFISPFCPPHCPLLRYVFDTLYLPHVDRAFPTVLSWSFTVSHSTLCLLKQCLIEAMEPVKQPESQDSPEAATAYQPAEPADPPRVTSTSTPFTTESLTPEEIALLMQFRSTREASQTKKPMREQSWDEYLQVLTARDIEIWQLYDGRQQVLRLHAQFYIHSILGQYNSHSNRHHRYQIALLLRGLPATGFAMNTTRLEHPSTWRTRTQRSTWLSRTIQQLFHHCQIDTGITTDGHRCNNLIVQRPCPLCDYHLHFIKIEGNSSQQILSS